MIAGASLWLIGGPPADLKNMADCQEWKGQRLKKIYVRKTTQHEENFFKLSFKGMIRFDLNMEHDSLKTDLRFAALKFAGGIERRNVGLTKMLSKVHVSRPCGGRQS